MGICIRISMKKVPEGATDAERRKMFEDHVDQLKRANAHLSPGRSAFGSGLPFMPRVPVRSKK